MHRTMNELLVALALVIALMVAFAAITVARAGERDPQQTFRDASGRTIGTATRSGNQTIFRDAGGRTTGSATTNGNQTIFRDNRGSTTGTLNAPKGRN